MIEAILVVLTKAYGGRHDDLNDWYSNIHVRDALRFRGSIAAQRFKLSAKQAQDLPADFSWEYLALYDVFDAPRFSLEHFENAETSRMRVTTAIDVSVLNDYHYYPLQYRNNNPKIEHKGGVIMEQLNAAPGQEEAFRSWYNEEYFPKAVKRAGVHSGGYLMFREHGQMIPTMPPHRYVALYKTNGPEAVGAWRDDLALRHCPYVDRASLLVTHWDVLTKRLNKDQVLHPTAAALAEEERARAEMGDKVFVGGRDQLAIS